MGGTEAWTRDRLHSLFLVSFLPPYSCWLSLLGALLRLLAMLLLTWRAALTAMLLTPLLLFHTFYKKPGKWAGR